MSDSDQPLPDPYAAWVEQILTGPIPREEKATCHQCAMCAHGQERSGAVFFNPLTKCCTYLPTLPNFLVGKILLDSSRESEAGRSTVVGRIAGRVAVTPSGLGQSSEFGLLYGDGPPAFGQSESLRCPHFLPSTGGCGIWRHRPGVCATWFCKHERGAVGATFWTRLAHLLWAVESDLSLWCIVELEAATPEFAAHLRRAHQNSRADAVETRIDEARYAQLWGTWAGREDEFFQACARLVEAMSWREIVDICGPTVRLLEPLVRVAHRDLISDSIPTRLTLGRFQIMGLAGDHYLMTSYSSFDPISVPERVARILPYFDGRLTDDAVTSIRSTHGLRASPSLLRRLVDFGILHPATDHPPAANRSTFL